SLLRGNSALCCGAPSSRTREAPRNVRREPSALRRSSRVAASVSSSSGVAFMRFLGFVKGSSALDAFFGGSARRFGSVRRFRGPSLLDAELLEPTAILVELVLQATLLRARPASPQTVACARKCAQYEQRDQAPRHEMPLGEIAHAVE